MHFVDGTPDLSGVPSTKRINFKRNTMQNIRYYLLPNSTTLISLNNKYEYVAI